MRLGQIDGELERLCYRWLRAPDVNRRLISAVAMAVGPLSSRTGDRAASGGPREAANLKRQVGPNRIRTPCWRFRHHLAQPLQAVNVGDDRSRLSRREAVHAVYAGKASFVQEL